MTRVAAGIAGDCAKAFAAGVVAYVVDERPSAIERGRAEKIGPRSDNVARGIADPAADALDAGIDGRPRGRIGFDDGEFVASRAITAEATLCARPLVEKRTHIGDQITDDRQMRERTDLHAIAIDSVRDVRSASPSRNAVHRHRARPAHPHTARESIRERRIEAALDVGDDVEDRLASMTRELRRS
jgi:hypothetical protein